MTDHDPSYGYSDRYRHHQHYRSTEAPFATDARRNGQRFWRYLRTRSAETWLFFAAGFLLATIIG